MDTKFDVLKMKAHSKNVIGCIPFLPWRLKVEIKKIYEIVDHALVLPPFFAKQLRSLQKSPQRIKEMKMNEPELKLIRKKNHNDSVLKGNEF